MILPSGQINFFNPSEYVDDGSWFTGKMNTQSLNFDPIVTGYSFIIWTKIPIWVTNAFPIFKSMTQKNFKSFDGISDMDLNTGEYTHTFNGNAYSYATSITKGNTDFSITHQEFSGSPIKNMYQYWVSGIRDPETDIATYCKVNNCEYGACNHTGELMYIMTRPDADNFTMKNIEFAAYYTAVFPTKIPLGHLNFSQNNHDSAEIQVNFKGDMHIGPQVDDYAYELLQTTYDFVTAGGFDPKDPGIGQTLGNPAIDRSNFKQMPDGSGNPSAPPSVRLNTSAGFNNNSELTYVYN